MDVVGSLKDAGFNENEIGDYMTQQRQNLQAAGFSDAEIDNHFGIPKTPQSVPQPLMDRFMKGTAIGRVLQATGEGAVKGFGEEQVGPNEANYEFLQRQGIFAQDGVEALFPQRLAWSVLAGIDTMARMPGAVMGAIAGAAGGVTKEVTKSEAGGEEAERDVMQLLTVGGIVAGNQPFTRVKPAADGTMKAEPIGGVPKGQDIQDAGRAIGNGETTPLMENKVAALYQQKGLHPAEVAADAAADPTIAQSILSVDPGDMPYGYQFHGYEALPEKVAEMEAVAERQQASIREPYFQNPTAKGKPFKTDAPLLTSEPEGVPEFGMPVAEGFELKPAIEKDDLRQQLLLEGKDVKYSDAEKQILSKISVGEEAMKRPLTWSRIYTDSIDKLFPMAKEVKASNLANLTDENNPYVLARLHAGYVGKADHFLNKGTFDLNTYENNGPSLKEILKPVSKDLNGFRAYMAASRAIELEGRGIESGFKAPGAERGAPPLIPTGLDAARSVLIEGHNKYEKTFRAVVDYQNRAAEYLRESGVLSEGGYQATVELNKMYVPFTRVMGVDEKFTGRGGGSSLQATNPMKRIAGSARDVVDPLESIIRNTYHFIEMAERNQIGTKLVDMLHRIGEAIPEEKIIEDVEGKVPATKDAIRDELDAVIPGRNVTYREELAHTLSIATREEQPGTISILRDGKRETYKVDPELAIAMKGLDVQSASWFVNALAAPASVLRAGAVLNPAFWMRHVFRDFLYATVTSKPGQQFTPFDMAKGLAGLIVKDNDYWEWLKGGGGNVGFAAMDRRYLQENLRELTGQTGLVGRTWNLLADPQAGMWQKAGAVGKLPFDAIGKFALDPLRAATQMAENASHLGVFKKSMSKAAAEDLPATTMRDQIIRSAWNSRDTAVDAARMGANMRAYNQIVAFGNIKFQDTDVVMRAIKNNPVRALTMIAGAVTVPSVTLWMANHNDPRYAEIPDWDKDLNWHIMTPTEIYRVPKPWAMGQIFGTAIERTLDQFQAERPHYDAMSFLSQLYDVSGPEFVPTAASPILDQFANRSTFTNRTLIPQAQEKFLPEYQYTPYTTELTKAVGRVVGAFPGISSLKTDPGTIGGPARAITSPILMENYVRAWTGTLGNFVLQSADLALRKQGILPDPPMPTPTLADIPIIKAFAVRYPSASAQSIQDFYDNYSRNNTYFQTFMAQAKEGNVIAMQHIQDMGGPMMFARLDGIQKTLGEHSKLVADIYKNPQIAPAEKRQLIDQLYYSMIQVARSGNQAIGQMQQALTGKNLLPAPVGVQ